MGTNHLLTIACVVINNHGSIDIDVPHQQQRQTAATISHLKLQQEILVIMLADVNPMVNPTDDDSRKRTAKDVQEDEVVIRRGGSS
jgi:hypothetical protein